MKLFLTMIAALAVRESNRANEDLVQISNGIVAATIVASLTT